MTLYLSAMQETASAEREGALTVDKRVGIGNQGIQGNGELELRDSLGRAHEEDLGLNAQVAALTRKSDLLTQELEDGKASWTLKRTSLRANATHHEGVEVRSRETEGGTSRGYDSSQGSGMHMIMDTPIVGGGTALVGSTV